MVKDNTVSSIILDVVIYIFLILLMIVTLYPIIYIFSVSLSSQAAFEAGKVVLWPVEPNLDAYKEIITGKTVPMSFLQAVIQHSFVHTSYFPGADNNACISVVTFKGQSSVSRSYYKADCIHNVLYSRYDSCILDSSDGWTA